MDNAEYHRHRAIGKSHLDAVARSPLHYWARYVDPSRKPEAPTPAMVLGSALHSRVLEPEKFPGEYVRAPDVDRRTKDGKAAWAELEASGATVLSAADWSLCSGMADAVRSHLAADRLLSRAGGAELSLFWTDQRTGLECKCRPDYLTDDGWIVDLKTTEDASPSGFAKSALNFRYHVQAAWYLRGVRQSGGEPRGFVFIAVEKKPPHAVAVYLADDDMVRLGLAEADRCLNRLAECFETEHWPGYGHDVQVLSLPAWAIKSSGVSDYV